jgi:hypothetical protein
VNDHKQELVLAELMACPYMADLLLMGSKAQRTALIDVFNKE